LKSLVQRSKYGYLVETRGAAPSSGSSWGAKSFAWC